MCSRMYMLVLQILCFLLGNELASSASEGDANNPVFNLDHTALEKNIAAVFNKVAHSSATTKRSVPAYEAQISQSTTHSTSPSPAITSLTTSLTLYPMIIPKVTNPPLFRELPSYAPPSRALFTPPLPPEYANPFADKPTLRGTNIDMHTNMRRPVPPPSLTPAHERIPIKPPDLIETTTINTEKHIITKDRVQGVNIKDQFEMSDREKDTNDTLDFVPSLHFTSISRILSGSNGRKQDIPEILLKPIPTKSFPNFDATKSVNEKLASTTLSAKLIDTNYQTSTYSSIITMRNEKSDKADDISDNNYYESSKKNNEPYKIQDINIVKGEKLPDPQPQPPSTSSKKPDVIEKNQNVISHFDIHPLESTWKIAWSLHVYLAATMFTLIALYSVYKIVRFNDATNLLTQSYFLTIHLLLTFVCTIRCFYLFYDAYNLGHSFPEALSKVLMFLPSSLLAAAFATLIVYMSRSTATSLYQNKLFSPVILLMTFIIHITLCISLHISGHLLGYADESRILPLICQCIYIIICVTLGLCYMYVYRVIRSQLHVTSANSVSNHITTDFMSTTLNTALTTTIATALLFILMGFVQLYGIFGVQERLKPYPWLWWGWEFSVRLIELSMCGLLAWVASLSQYQMREKHIQQHVVHPGFALFPCASSTSTENMDDALYPAICSTNQAIQNYTIRTGKQVYDDSFPLNTLPDHLNVSNTFERHSVRRSGTLNQFPQDMRSSFGQCRSDTQSLCKLDDKIKHNSMTKNIQEHSAASGSTMLVAEDGFVRFRNLGSDEDNSSDPRNLMESSTERRNSITCSDRLNMKQSAIITQNHQNSLPHLHLSFHRNQHQIYNNT